MGTPENQPISELQITRKNLSKNPYDIAVGELIKKQREIIHLNQDQLGSRLFLSQGMISEIETGVRGLYIRDMLRWAMALECEPAKLIPSEFMTANFASHSLVRQC